MRTFLVVLMLLSIAIPAAAAAVDGNWSGSVAGPNGEFTFAFLFKADGDKLTGSMVGFDGTPVPIANGKIEGSNITFSVDLDFNGNAFTISYKGVVGDGEIKMSADAAGRPFEFVLKKAK